MNLLDINNLDDNEISVFLGDLVKLNEKTRNAVKESIANVYLSQTKIDGFYLVFLNYSNNLAEIKSNWDGLDNSTASITTTYDTQISSLSSQIVVSKTSLENLETNKVDSVNVGLDLQLSGIESQLKTLESNLDNLLSQKSNLQTTKKTQILNLENQILQIEQSIESLSTNLSTRYILAGISGIIKQKNISLGNTVGVGMPICQIIPNINSTKIKIYSQVELNIGSKLNFDFNGDNYEIIIETVLVYKDPATQNYIYESNYLDKNSFKDGEILSLTFDVDKINNIQKIDKNIKIPVSYVKNKIDGNFVKISSDTLISEQQIELGDINGAFVEVKAGLEGIIEVCK